MENLNELIKQNKGLVYTQLHRFNLINNQDAESLAFEALYKACVDYDEARGTKLSTLASVYIYNALGTYIRSLKKKRKLDVISYNTIVYSDDDVDHELSDLLPSKYNIEETLLQSEQNKVVRSVYEELLRSMHNKKHIAIIKCWEDYDFSAQTTTIAREVNVSQSYASQVIAVFKGNMKKKLEDLI